MLWAAYTGKTYYVEQDPMFSTSEKRCQRSFLFSKIKVRLGATP